MSSDMHDLLSRMADELDNYRQLLTDDRREVHALAAEARAALAAAPESAVKQSLTTALAAAPEGEVGELVAWLRLNGDSFAAGRRHAHDLTFQSFHRAATLLEQLAAPAPAVVPVPVSERLPGEGDCDAEGRCWWGSPCGYITGAAWSLRAVALRKTWDTHWLPAHALPLPTRSENG